MKRVESQTRSRISGNGGQKVGEESCERRILHGAEVHVTSNVGQLRSLHLALEEGLEPISVSVDAPDGA